MVYTDVCAMLWSPRLNPASTHICLLAVVDEHKKKNETFFIKSGKKIVSNRSWIQLILYVLFFFFPSIPLLTFYSILKCHSIWCNQSWAAHKVESEIQIMLCEGISICFLSPRAYYNALYFGNATFGTIHICPCIEFRKCRIIELEM